MTLSPKERSDFDAIVARLRLEDVGAGMIAPRRRSTALLLSVLAAALVFALGVTLVEHNPNAFAPVLVAVAMIGGMVVALRACVRHR